MGAEVITRTEAERLILETYNQLSVPLSELNGLATGDEPERREIREIYELYSSIIGGRPERTNVKGRIDSELKLELQAIGKDALQEIFEECREVAELMDLPVRGKMPQGEISILSWFGNQFIGMRWNGEQQKIEWIPMTLERLREILPVGNEMSHEDIKNNADYAPKDYFNRLSMKVKDEKTNIDSKIILLNTENLKGIISTTKSGLDFVSNFSNRFIDFKWLTPLLPFLSLIENNIETLQLYFSKLNKNPESTKLEEYSLGEIFKDLFSSFNISFAFLNKHEKKSQPTNSDKPYKLEGKSRLMKYLEENIKKNGITTIWSFGDSELVIDLLPPELKLSYDPANFRFSLSTDSAKICIDKLESKKFMSSFGTVFKFNGEETTVSFDFSSILNLNKDTSIETNLDFPFSFKDPYFNFDLYKVFFKINMRL